MNTKISSNRQKKEKIVAKIVEKLDKADSLVFANFEGLTHKQLEEFKKGLRKLDAQFAVVKNTLLKKALGEEKIKGFEDKFEQPTGTLFLYGDPVAPLKLLAKMIKEFEKPKIKFGFLDGRAVTEAEVLKLATLPTKEVLLTQLVIGLKSPISGLHRALSWNLQKFVMTLKAIENKKEVK